VHRIPEARRLFCWCQVGDTKLYYSFPKSSQYYFNMVISNTRVPVAAVSAVIAGKSVALARSSNNNWVYHNSQGSYSFPMEITVTPVCGAVVRSDPHFSSCGLRLHPSF